MEAMLQLSAGTMDLLDGYSDDGIAFEMHSEGLLAIFLSRHQFEAHQEHFDVLAPFGLEPRILIGDAVRAQEPALSAAVFGGILFPAERHLDPAALVSGLHRRCVELGVEIVENAPIDRVEKRATRVTAVYAGATRFASDAFLLAAGSWSGRLSRLFGFGLPIRPGKGYSLDLPRLGIQALPLPHRGQGRGHATGREDPPRGDHGVRRAR